MFSLSLSSFFLSPAEKSKNGRSHCHGVSKVNRLLALCTYLLFSWSAVSVEGVETDPEHALAEVAGEEVER